MNRVVKLIEDLAVNLTNTPEVLIVEDSRDDVDLISYSLNKVGCQVYSCDNLNDVIKIFNDRLTKNKDYPFDIVLLDLKLIGPDGTEVLKYIHRVTPKIPVILVTGHPSGEMIEKAMKIGYFGLVSKPLEKLTIEKIFQQHKINYRES